MPHPPTDPRSPVQPGGKFPIKPLLLALVAAASLWTWQQSRERGDRPEPRRDRRDMVPTPPAPPAVGRVRARQTYSSRTNRLWRTDLT